MLLGAMIFGNVPWATLAVGKAADAYHVRRYTQGAAFFLQGRGQSRGGSPAAAVSTASRERWRHCLRGFSAFGGAGKVQLAVFGGLRA